jgi:hypothetical protein
MEADQKLLRQVEAARGNMARIEGLVAIKAQMEISRRLDMIPEQIKDSDLLRYKDSGIRNSFLMPEGEYPRIVSPLQLAVEFAVKCRARGLIDEEIIQGLDWLEEVDKEARELVKRVICEPKQVFPVDETEN